MGEERSRELGDVAKLPRKEKQKLTISGQILTGAIWLEIDKAPEGEPAFRIKKGRLFIDREALKAAKDSVKKALADSISSGDEAIFSKLTRGIESTRDEELIELYEQLLEAFKRREKNPFKLKEINVDLLTDGIAERNIIREGLKPHIKQLPFVFRNRNGEELDRDRDVDFVFIRDKDKDYKLIVGSKKGIGGIELPDELGESQFAPDLLGITKDSVTDTIIIPLKAARDGIKPLVPNIEIRKGPIDLVRIVSYEEETAKAKKKRGEEDEKKRYSPPPPRAPRRSSESGGYGYTNVSG